MSKLSRPYGTWPSPISADDMSTGHRLYDAQYDTSGALIWQERRSHGASLVVQHPDQNPRDIVRDARIGGGLLFGGGGFTVGGGDVYFVGDASRIYRVSIGGGVPRPITPAFGTAAAPSLSPNGKWLMYVHSYEGRDALCVVPTDGSAYPRKLIDDADFIMHPTWHPYGDRVACITWQHPHMPWDSSQLHLLYISSDAEPSVVGRQVIAGQDGNESVFGAAFSPDSGYLAYASDHSDWWQLYVYDLDTEQHIQLTNDHAEYATPAWLQDMRTFAWAADSRALYTLRNADSRITLQRVAVESGDMTAVAGLESFDYLEQVTVSPVTGEVTVIASSPRIPDRVVSVQPETGKTLVRAYSHTEHIPDDFLANVQLVEWQSDGVTIPGMYYPPTHPTMTSGGTPPLLVYIHSGPTRQRFTRFFPQPHYFASRGFAVLEANYRGSTGYGRAFKDMHKGQWGVVDVVDNLRGAEMLVSRGLADKSKLVVMGESSGGFSVLQSLVAHPNFYRAGIAQAPVADQFALAMETHKFERHYSDSLLGTLPDAAQVYHDRSPAFHADQIKDPLALFHGTADNVVPVGQSDAVVSALRRRGVPHIFQRYEGEGHGFRQPETIRDYYDQMTRFLLRHVIYAV